MYISDRNECLQQWILNIELTLNNGHILLFLLIRTIYNQITHKHYAYK